MSGVKGKSGVYVRSEATKAKMSAYFTGKKKPPRTVEHRNNLSLSKKGEKHPNWKGDAVGYIGIHHWIHRNYGKACECKNCSNNNAKAYDWANVSGTYKRDINDWVQLCRSCHIAFDKMVYQAKIDYYKNLIK